MRALRRCDFCAGDPVGTFEIVPSALEPTEAEQRRAILCDDCKNRLETLLEPLLVRAGVDADAPGSELDGGETEESDVATADESTTERSRATSSNAAVSAPSAVDSADARDDAKSTDDRGGETGGDADADASSTPSTTGGITVEHADRDAAASSGSDADDSNATAIGSSSAIDAATDRSSESDDENGDDSGADDADRDAPGDSPADGATDEQPADDSNATGGPSASTAASKRGLRTYAKVVRLLRNRKAPMDRRAIESLAANAYDLETREVEAIIDRAIENGEFVEEEGVLRPA
ncbi:hypothetical protein [Halosolutus gelatinilyticus]|uniref:hypothetical protein n=1 Tax=Halosolutus gelatinilyticus TaxID=2931975 RepID=UPI001FF1489D|nr:hypothetical protein [Halosolutus gelatinilyticus]